MNKYHTIKMYHENNISYLEKIDENTNYLYYSNEIANVAFMGFYKNDNLKPLFLIAEVITKKDESKLKVGASLVIDCNKIEYPNGEVVE